jgi:ATP-binding cassette subfamily A (ABC1) protein 3
LAYITSTIIKSPLGAFAALVVAMDAHLIVREHLFIYGRLRGLEGEQLESDINSLIGAAGLDSYANRLATKLSGGNQRKLALAIALIGTSVAISE